MLFICCRCLHFQTFFVFCFSLWKCHNNSQSIYPRTSYLKVGQIFWNSSEKISCAVISFRSGDVGTAEQVSRAMIYSVIINRHLTVTVKDAAANDCISSDKKIVSSIIFDNFGWSITSGRAWAWYNNSKLDLRILCHPSNLRAFIITVDSNRLSTPTVPHQ